jgi:hypothetical protein
MSHDGLFRNLGK